MTDLLSPSPTLASAYAHCESLLRAEDDDRWRAILFAPMESRSHLHALYAFNLEIARVRASAAEAAAGEIRYQWWRDALAGAARGEAGANPVMAALDDTIDRFRLPRAALVALIDARVFDLYDDPMPSLADLEGYCGETSSALMRLASIIVARGEDPGGADATGHAGVAYALCGLMRALPWHARQGRIFLPLDMLSRQGVTRDDIVSGRGGPGLGRALAELRAAARDHLARCAALKPSLARAALIACAPAALVGPYLGAMQKRGADPLRDIVDIAPLRKMWRLWRWTW